MELELRALAENGESFVLVYTRDPVAGRTLQTYLNHIQ